MVDRLALRFTPFALLLAAAPLAAGGVVEIEAATPVTTISREQLEQLPAVHRDLSELVRLVPNAAGVTRFEGDAGSYTLRTGGRDAPFVIRDDEVQSLRLGGDGRLTDAPEPFRTSFRPPDARAVGGADFTYRVENQLVTVELTTPAGTIFLSAPEQAPDGSSTSWSSTVIAAGGSERERARNRSRLEAMRIEIGPTATEVAPGAGVRVPALPAVRVALRDGDRTVASGTVPLFVRPIWSPDTGGVATSSNALPAVFAGGSLTIPGSFDGDATNTRITVDGRPVRVVAESAYGASIYTPVDRVGRLEIVVEEGVQRGSGSFSNLGLEIAADKTDLRRGETTTCRIAVHGLAGLDAPVRLVLVNRTPGVVSMAPSDRQIVRIDPGSHDGRGTVRLDRRFTGVERGQFHLQAILLPPGARLPGAPR